MKRRALLFLAGWLAISGASCTLPGTRGQVPGELGKRFAITVPGTWYHEETRGDAIGSSTKTFRWDGTAQGVLNLKRRSGGVSVVLPPVTFRSKWRIQGDTYLSYDVQASVPGYFKPGTVFRDRILSVAPDRIVCRSEESGRVFTMTRKR